MISSYGMLTKELELVNSIDWDCVIFDEVHKIKDRASKVCRACNEMRCLRRYGLTGTVMQNNFEELWCLLDWASQSLFQIIFLSLC
jgi:SNF2 family DNA or RNA helicase